MWHIEIFMQVVTNFQIEVHHCQCAKWLKHFWHNLTDIRFKATYSYWTGEDWFPVVIISSIGTQTRTLHYSKHTTCIQHENVTGHQWNKMKISLAIKEKKDFDQYVNHKGESRSIYPVYINIMSKFCCKSLITHLARSTPSSSSLSEKVTPTLVY